MSDCAFTTIAEGLHRCALCGSQVRSPHPPEWIHRRCPKAESGERKAERPNPTSDILHPTPNYLSARIASKIRLGLATRSAVEIEACLARCRACDQFERDRCRRYCKGCPDTWSKWIEVLTGGQCDRWQEESAA